MEKKITIEELRKRKLFVATPMYGGKCDGPFTRSICDLTSECVKLGVPMTSYFLFNESLITRARNYCVDAFLRSDFTHMMFIDSDIEFDPRDVITLLALMDDDVKYDVLGAAYPKKNISWEKIKHAVDKGAADDDPNNLENFVGDFVFNPIIESSGPVNIPLTEPADVLELGTGFMMIKRSIFERYAKYFEDKNRSIMYRPDHVRSAEFDGSRRIGMYFQAAVDPDDPSERYLSEDYWFCQNVRKLGGHIGMCPWMNLRHSGTYTFGGSLRALASIGASPTADHSKVRKKVMVDTPEATKIELHQGEPPQEVAAEIPKI